MYLGYDEFGNIITKDPSGERGEFTRPLPNEDYMSLEEIEAKQKKAKKAQRKQKWEEAKAKAEQGAKLQREAYAKKQVALKKEKSKKFLHKKAHTISGAIFTQMGGTIGNGLTKHSVSGEVLASTFARDYGMSGADFGRDQMGGITSDAAKALVSKVYVKMLAYEQSIDKLRKAYKPLDKNSDEYKKLKAAYDSVVKAYMQTPVSYGGISFKSRQEAAFKFAAAVVTAVETFDKDLASEIDQMFNNPLAYDQKMKAGKTQNILAGYSGFSSEFDQQGMGVVPLAAWLAVGAGLTATGVTAANAALKPDTKIDDLIASTDKLISEAKTAAEKAELLKQRAALVETKAKDVATKSVTGVTGAITSTVGSIQNLALIGTGLWFFFKIGMPLLQGAVEKKKSSQSPMQQKLSSATGGV